MRAHVARFVLLLAVVGGGACATKKDVDQIRDELASLQRQQDEVTRLISELNRSMSAALEEHRNVALTTRGDVRRQLDDMERQLVQIQALLGQSQIVLNSLRQRMESREWADVATQVDTLATPDSLRLREPGGLGRESGGDARVLYTAAIEQFRRGAYNTARMGFEEFLVAYPADDLAPDAQYYLAETYREEKDAERAIREYNRVVELYPNSSAAPTALYKAGLLQVEQGNKNTACEYFQRVLAGYPRSDESRLARDQAGRLNCR